MKKLLTLLLSFVFCTQPVLAQRSAASARSAASSRTAASGGVPALVKYGFGANATGGEGHSTVFVTNLNDSGAGSFREAVSSGNRIVKFQVGGYIDLQSALLIDADNITIDGTDAPNFGICFRGHTLGTVNSNNQIWRGIHSRSNTHAETIDSFRVQNSFNLLFDHCSFTHGNDGCLDITGGSHDITVQFCLIFESLGSGNMLFGNDSYNLSVIKCVLGNGSRCGGELLFGEVDYVNNIVFRDYVKENADRYYENVLTLPPDVPSDGSQGASNGTRALLINVRGNRFIAGSEEDADDGKKAVYTYGDRFRSSIAVMCFKQNYCVSTRESDALSETAFVSMEAPITFTGTEHNHQRGFTPANPFDAGFEDSILDNVGCIYPGRDALDAAIIAGIRARSRTTGRFGAFNDISEAGGYPSLSGTPSGSGNPRQAASSRAPIAMIIVMVDPWSLKVMLFGMVALALLAALSMMLRRRRRQ